MQLELKNKKIKLQNTFWIVLIAGVFYNCQNSRCESKNPISKNKIDLDTNSSLIHISSASYIITTSAPTPQIIEINCNQSNLKLNNELSKCKKILLLHGKDTLLRNGYFEEINGKEFKVNFIRAGLFFDLSEDEIHKLLKNVQLIFVFEKDQFKITNEINNFPIATNYVKSRGG